MDALFRLGVLVRMKDMMSGPAGTAGRALESLKSQASGLKDQLKIGGIATAAGVGITALASKGRNLISGLVKPVLEVHEAAAKLQTVWQPTVGAMGESIGRATKEAREWAREHKQSATEFLETAYLMASAGLKEVQAIEGTKAALGTAISTFGDGQTAAKLLATLYLTLGDRAANTASEMTRLGDVVSKTQQYFKIADLGQLNEGLKYGIPVARQYQVRLEDLASVIGALNNVGLEGGQAGTAFAASMRQLLRAAEPDQIMKTLGKGKKQRTVMVEGPGLGIDLARYSDGAFDFIGTLDNIRRKFGTFKDLTEDQQRKFQQVFGDEGIRAISQLLGSTDELRGGLHAVSNAAGTIATTMGTVEGVGKHKLLLLQRRAEDLWYRFGDAALPVLERMMPRLESLIAKVDEFIARHPGLAEWAAWALVVGTALGTILGPLTTLVGGLIVFRGLRAAAGLAAAATGAASLGAAMGTAATQGGLLSRALGGVLRVGGSLLGGLFKGGGKLLGGLFKGGGKLLGGALKMLGKGASRFIPGLGVGLLAMDVLDVAGLDIGGKLLGVWDGVTTGVGEMWRSITGQSDKGANKMTGAVTTAVHNGLDALNNARTDFGDSGKSAVDAFGKGFTDGLPTVAREMRQGISAAVPSLDFYRHLWLRQRGMEPPANADKEPAAPRSPGLPAVSLGTPEAIDLNEFMYGRRDSDESGIHIDHVTIKELKTNDPEGFAQALKRTARSGG